MYAWERIFARLDPQCQCDLWSWRTLEAAAHGHVRSYLVQEVPFKKYLRGAVSYQAGRTEKPQIDFFFGKNLLLAHRVRLDESFPMGPCSTSGDENSLRYDLGPHHCDCHVSTQ